MVMLMVEMMILALVSPSTMVMALPKIGMKAKKPIHKTSISHESFCQIQFLLLHVQIFLYPFHLAQSAYTIVEQRAQYISYAAIYHQRDGIQTCCLQARHHYLAAERKETAGKKGGNKHAPIAPVD